MTTTNTSRKLLTIAAVAAIVLTAGIAAAQGLGGQNQGGLNSGIKGKGLGQGGRGAFCDGPARGSAGFGPYMAERLGLSEEQQAKIEEIREQGRAQNLELRKELMRLRNELDGEMLKDEPAEGKVVDLTSKIGEIRTQEQTNMVKTRLAVRKVLTPEQRDQMLLMGKGGRGHGRHGGFGRGDCDGSGPRGGRGQGRGPGRFLD